MSLLKQINHFTFGYQPVQPYRSFVCSPIKSTAALPFRGPGDVINSTAASLGLMNYSSAQSIERCRRPITNYSPARRNIRCRRPITNYSSARRNIPRWGNCALGLLCGCLATQGPAGDMGDAGRPARGRYMHVGAACEVGCAAGNPACVLGGIPGAVETPPPTRKHMRLFKYDPFGCGRASLTNLGVCGGVH
jgi:hypothetical protein